MNSDENKKLVDAKIYRIVSNITGQNYYGSTCEKYLCNRLAKHRGNYKRYLAGKYHYVTSFKILETNDFDIILVEKLENCKSKDELHARERFYIENNECVNKVIPNRTTKQYYVDNKQKISEQMNEYYHTNRNKVLEYKATPHNCICGISHRYGEKARHQKSQKHQNYIKNNIKTISGEDYQFIFECDSLALIPSTYPNYIIV
ncbi:MAG: hypothetical protein JSS98_06165 [Bacteroidetes bacterium]|nr:hypothetical protein [Bacteroidota bacterium]